MATITAQEAERILSADVKQWNGGGRRLPHTPNRIRLLMAQDVVHICNVGPWERYLDTATFRGTIPAYDRAKDPQGLGYVMGPAIPTVVRTGKIVNEDEYGYVEDDGIQVAEEAIGIGYMMPMRNAIVQEGFFVAKANPPNPTKDELRAALAALDEYLNRLIADARDAYDKGPEERKAVISADRHLLAARIKGVDEPWVHHSHTIQNVRCQMCGKHNPSGVAKCACGSILNVDLYKQLKKQQIEMEAEADMEVQTAPEKKHKG
jgi:hypothetical protein